MSKSLGRRAPEQQVANASTDEVGAVAALVEPIHDAKGVGVDLVARDAMLCARNDLGVDHVSRV